MKVLIEGTTPCAELNIKNSRFIAEAFTVHDSLEAREKLHEQKKRYSDATHVCHAFVCGKDGGINGMSDDGEPGGTAGRPMLDVLKGSGITDILVTVTRYFGGTLLGTGGLVHAYSDSVKAVLEACQTEELVEKSTFTFSVEYPLYEIAMRFLSSFHTDSIKEDFASQVLISGCIWASETSSLEEGIRNLSKGKSQVQFSQ
ncbi:MAG: YigZ family protein [Treponema sp.]|nr:YigZ family protein [Treponema sp.]MBQ5451063.1 YigZ family protein [Treponema sp.]